MRASSKDTKENSGFNQLYKIIAKEKEIEDANSKREEQLQEQKRQLEVDNAALSERIARLEQLKEEQSKIVKRFLVLETIQSAPLPVKDPPSSSSATTTADGLNPSHQPVRFELNRAQVSPPKSGSTLVTKPMVPPKHNTIERDKNGVEICIAFKYTGYCQAGVNCKKSHLLVPFPYCHRLNYAGACTTPNCKFLHDYYKGEF